MASQTVFTLTNSNSIHTNVHSIWASSLDTWEDLDCQTGSLDGQTDYKDT